MEKITCKHCGTKYAAGVAKCPVCGSSNAPEIEDAFDFLEDRAENAEVTARETQPVQETAQQTQPEASEPAAETDGAYNWEDILAELGSTPEGSAPEPSKTLPRQEPAAQKIPAQDPEQEAPAAPRTRQARPESGKKREKKGGKTVLAVLLVAVILVAGFMALKQTGVLDSLFSKKDQEVTPELPVEPKDVACTKVSLSETQLTLDAIGKTQALTVSVEPADCTDPVNWVSANPAVATVDKSGNVTAVSEGEANILVSCGEFAATCTVTVSLQPAAQEPDTPADTQPEPTGEMAMNLEDISLFYPGEMAQLAVENCPADQTVNWSVENENILKVDETGLVTALGTGTTKVTATVGEQSFSCIVRCRLGGTEGERITVSLNSTDISMFYVGETFRLEVQYEQGEPEGSSYSWKSSDETVCTVDDKGTITAVGSGTANVTTEVGGVSLRCIVRVNLPKSDTTENG